MAAQALNKNNKSQHMFKGEEKTETFYKGFHGALKLVHTHNNSDFTLSVPLTIV